MRNEGESAEVPINATAKPSPIRQAQRQGQGPRLGQPQLPAPQPRPPWLVWVWEGHRVSPHARRSLCLPPSQSLGWATLTAKPLGFGQRQRQQPLALRNGWVAMQDGKRRAQSRTMLFVALAKSVFARAPRPPPTIFRRGRNRNPIGSSRAKSPH